MNPPPDERGKRLIEAFNEAKELPVGAQRNQFLDQACGMDEQFRSELHSLLRAGISADNYLQGGPAVSPQLEAEFARLKPEEVGDQIGPYKLREQIGEGGFGTVWVAEQEVPVRRRVAVKLLKVGMDTREVIARFEQERQALAIMDHPNIARVIDAGATQFGRPFFVMELVRGVKITEYCDEHQLSTEERIDLFIAICHAVQHAHQKGIIHRDLKPSNILVTINDGKAVPKVIDFGVAKAMAGRLTENTVYTQFQQMIGTPLYMSPEQAEMTSVDIDTRSDIYSLGVLLYELLTGHTPIDRETIARIGLDEIRRIIREVDPLRPSIRVKTLAGDELTTAAKRRQTDATRLPASLRGDVDWIVMKCLEKDRQRRYGTAAGLALDLQRHLANEVVTARPPTTGYLLGRLIRRNKLAFAAGAGIAVALLVGITVSVWQAVRATQAEQSMALTLDELKATAPAFAEQARALAAKERFDEAIEKLDYAVKLRPDVVDYLVAKGDLLQCQITKLADAAAIYRQALRVSPGHPRAEASAKLCEELLAATPGEQGKLSRESLARLHVAMQQQQRPASELMPVARLLGEEKRLLVDYWLARLKDLPVSGEKPLKERLTIREDGQLALDLSDTKVSDLSPLAEAPLSSLSLAGCSELKDISALRGRSLFALDLTSTRVADLSPLREMRTLEELTLAGSHVVDLSPLGELQLKGLDLTFCAVSNLWPIRKMPLEEMSLRGTRVADLAPIAGMPIKMIDLTQAPVLDFSPLAKLPLEKCYLQHNRLTDLSIFRGMPLKELVLWGCSDARNYAVLQEIETLELLLLPSEYRALPTEDYAAIGALRDHPRLRQMGSEIMGGMGFTGTGSKEAFWQDWDREQTFVPRLRESGASFSVIKRPSGSYAVYAQNNKSFKNLAIFTGAPIHELHLANCDISDLTPLRGLPLRILNVANNPVIDLTPLRGMPLEDLNASGTMVADLSPLEGLPLKALYLTHCNHVRNVEPLKTLSTLELLTIPPGCANVEALRSLPRLRRIAYSQSGAPLYHPSTTAEEFWKGTGGGEWIAWLVKAGCKPGSIRRLENGTWDVKLTNLPISDLSVLRGAPISHLDLGGTLVSDLSPLRGMPLKVLTLYSTAVADLQPLSGMALTYLHLSNTQVSDLSVLRGMPLIYLRLHDCAQITDVSSLLECETLALLTVPPNARNIEVLRSLPNLKRLGYAEDEVWKPDQAAADFWKEFDVMARLRALRVEGIAIEPPKRELDGTWSIRCNDPKFSDLTAFRGVAISNLDLTDTAVADLAPLRGLPLKSLLLFGTKVSDLSPLSSIALENLDVRSTLVTDLTPLRSPTLSRTLKGLHLWNTKITDFSPVAACTGLEEFDAGFTGIESLEVVRGRKLRVLRLWRAAKIQDLSPVAGMPLEKVELTETSVKDLRPLLDSLTLRELVLPPHAEDVESLRKLPNLARLSYEPQHGTAKHTAGEFWREFDKQGSARASEAAGPPPR